MIDVYLELFYEVAIKLVAIIPAVLAVYLVIKLVADLLFKE